MEELQKDQDEHDKITLTQLSMFNPGVQTHLLRISELVNIEKLLVEESIKRIIQKLFFYCQIMIFLLNKVFLAA
ncbi:MAG: hypothetical protein HeimC3_34440 [Candidatus Heimdallarchaeota archaeon LC_3]|nr:MAG: hypothetical protein HeimC3_34440 [Candidatus Heimdallarchaeota archaeon LC_3]